MHYQLSTYTLTLTAIGVLGHPSMDWSVVNSRTCPYEGQMEQRLARFSELINFVSNNVPFGATEDSFTSTLSNELFDEELALTFPQTVTESDSYFTYGAFAAGLLDLSGHTAWYSLDGLLYGESANDTQPAEYYGAPSNVSLYQFLQELPFGIRLVHGNSWFWCDEDAAWGFNSANVYITEKISAEDAGNGSFINIQNMTVMDATSTNTLLCTTSSRMAMSTSIRTQQ